MRTNAHRMQLGELVVAAFDEAALHTQDRREQVRQAAQTIVCVLMQEWKTAMLNRPRSPGGSRH